MPTTAHPPSTMDLVDRLREEPRRSACCGEPMAADRCPSCYELVGAERDCPGCAEPVEDAPADLLAHAASCLRLRTLAGRSA